MGAYSSVGICFGNMLLATGWAPSVLQILLCVCVCVCVCVLEREKECVCKSGVIRDKCTERESVCERERMIGDFHSCVCFLWKEEV